MTDNLLLHRFIRSRPHLSLAVALGVVVTLCLPRSEPLLTRTLTGWNAGVWAYLASMMWLMARADHHKVRAIADKQDESAGLVLVTLVIGAVLSLTAVVSELTRMDNLPANEQAMRYGFTALTVFGSWFLVGVLYCFHYAHLFYRAGASDPPLRFPEKDCTPDYWDFLYFSFTIAVAVQTSDVSVMNRTMRKLVLGHSVLAFFFNLVVLGLSINIAASLVNH